jgi:hypothetical protein
MRISSIRPRPGTRSAGLSRRSNGIPPVVSPRRHHRHQPAHGPDWVVRFYNQRGTAEQHMMEGKYAFRWTRLSRKRFRDN